MAVAIAERGEMQRETMLAAITTAIAAATGYCLKAELCSIITKNSKCQNSYDNILLHT